MHENLKLYLLNFSSNFWFDFSFLGLELLKKNWEEKTALILIKNFYSKEFSSDNVMNFEIPENFVHKK